MKTISILLPLALNLFVWGLIILRFSTFIDRLVISGWKIHEGGSRLSLALGLENWVYSTLIESVSKDICKTNDLYVSGAFIINKEFTRTLRAFVVYLFFRCVGCRH